MKTLFGIILISYCSLGNALSQSTIELEVNLQSMESDTLRTFAFDQEYHQAVLARFNKDFGDPQIQKAGMKEWQNVKSEIFDNEITIRLYDGFIIESPKSMKFVVFKNEKQIEKNEHPRFTYFEILDEKGKNIVNSKSIEQQIIQWIRS